MILTGGLGQEVLHQTGLRGGDVAGQDGNGRQGGADHGQSLGLGLGDGGDAGGLSGAENLGEWNVWGLEEG